MMNKNDVINAVNNFLPQYEYEYDMPYEVGDGVYEIINEWYSNKANTPIFRALEKHPSYNGRFQIVLDGNFHRRIDASVAQRFYEWMQENIDYKRVDRILFRGEEIDVDLCYTATNHIRVNYGGDGMFYSGIHFDIRREDASPADGRQIVTGAQLIALNNYFDNPTQYLDDEVIEKLNLAFPKLKIHRGAKASRVIRRICVEFGLDKLDKFNEKWPKFADSVNPLNVPKWTIISWNPIDYLTMSFGRDWQSCHTIDKTGKRGVGGNHYNGCYSSGTLSYMMDPSSVVVYTVDKSYEGNEFEYQPKDSRQMFHISDDIIVQGRLYPQANDTGSKDIYDTLRNIVQRVYAEAMHVPNLWKKTSGTSACESVMAQDPDGTNYRDWEYFDNCTVSKRNEWGGQLIEVGHAPICPLCGNEHYREDNIMCEDCASGVECYHCGCRVNREDAILTEDGHYFCDRYCAAEEEYVECYNDSSWRYRDDDGVIYDDYMEEYYHVSWYDDFVTTEDGRTFYSEDHARHAGYVMLDNGSWVKEDKSFLCPVCGHLVSEDDYDSDLEMCEDCAAKAERGVC